MRLIRLPLLGLATLVYLAGLGLWVALEWRDYQANLAERQALFARILADHATRTLDGVAQTTAQVALDVAARPEADAKELSALLTQAMAYQPGLRGLLLLDAEGTVRASTRASDVGLRLPLQPLQIARHLGQPLWVAAPVNVRSLADLGQAGRRSPPGVAVLPFVHRLESKNLPWLVGQVNPDTFRTFHRQTLTDETMHAALLTLDGEAVSSGEPLASDANQHRQLEAYRRFLPDREWGHWQGLGLRGESQHVDFRLAARWPLMAVVETSRQDGLHHWWTERQGELSLAGGAGLLLLLALGATIRFQAARQQAVEQRDAAEAAVTERDKNLEVLLESLQETVFRTDRDGQLVYVSPQAESLFGEPAEDLLGRRLWELVSSPHRGRVRAVFQSPNAASAQRLAVALSDRPGQPASHVDLRVRALEHNGEITGFAGSAVDATGRVKAQQALEAQLNFLQQILELNPLPISIFDMSRVYVFVNPAWERFIGRDRDQVLGQKIGWNLSASQRALHEARDQELLASGRPQRYEAQLQRADGALRDVILFKLLLPGDSLTPSRIVTKILDVTELRDAERALQDARNAAEDASRTKSEFIANISHELRTPLQSIIGFSEIGGMRSGEHPRLRQMFGDILGAGQRMLGLVNDLLDVAKLDSAVGAIHLERTELGSLIRGVVDELAPLLAAKRLNAQVSVEPPGPLAMKADPQRLQQILRNLLANAIKFSPEGGTIRVAAERQNPDVHLQVIDEGPGIPAGELEAIFDAFTQSSRTKDGSGGTGLGLTISQKIAEAHGGRIWAENRPQGGACFHVKLALRPGGDPPTEPMPL